MRVAALDSLPPCAREVGTAGRRDGFGLFGFFGVWVGTLGGVLTRVWRAEVEGRRGGVFGSTAHRSNLRTRPAMERKGRVGEGRDGQRRASGGRPAGATRAASPGRRCYTARGQIRGVGATGGARARSAHPESMFPIATPTRSATAGRVTSREPAGARAPAAESDARDEAPSPSVLDKRRNGAIDALMKRAGADIEDVG